MAAFGTLTAEQQTQYLDFVASLRSTIGADLARALNHLAAVNDYWLSNIGPINNLLDAGTAVPLDNSGLANISPVTPFQVGSVLNHIQLLLAVNTDANRQIWSGFCGPSNMTG